MEQASETLTGIEAKDAIGKSIYEVFGDTDQTKRSADMYREVLATQQSQTFENEFQLGGKRYVFEIHAYPTRRGVSVFARDITERRLMERRLESLSNIIEQARDGVMVTNLNYEITYANEEAQRNFGYSLDELMGKSPAIFNAEPNAEGMQNEIYQAVSSGKAFLGSALDRRKDGSTFVCEFKVFPLYEHGDIVAYAAFQRDITERKQEEEALRESGRSSA